MSKGIRTWNLSFNKCLISDFSFQIRFHSCQIQSCYKKANFFLLWEGRGSVSFGCWDLRAAWCSNTDVRVEVSQHSPAWRARRTTCWWWWFALWGPSVRTRRTAPWWPSDLRRFRPRRSEHGRALSDPAPPFLQPGTLGWTGPRQTTKTVNRWVTFVMIPSDVAVLPLWVVHARWRHTLTKLKTRAGASN